MFHTATVRYACVPVFGMRQAGHRPVEGVIIGKIWTIQRLVEKDCYGGNSAWWFRELTLGPGWLGLKCISATYCVWDHGQIR